MTPLSVQVLAGDAGRFDPVRWLGDPPPEELAVLDRVRGPVLDVGCGPGRHVVELNRRGLVCLGIDITPTMVELARRRGACVLERSVFDHLPGAGRWGTILLLDGNLGIGADPSAILSRAGELLGPGGRLLVELTPTSVRAPCLVRLDQGAEPGRWFRWADVGVDWLAGTNLGRFATSETWTDNGRVFTQLDVVATAPGP